MILYTYYYVSINTITIIVEKTLTQLSKKNKKNKKKVPKRERRVFNAL